MVRHNDIGSRWETEGDRRRQRVTQGDRSRQSETEGDRGRQRETEGDRRDRGNDLIVRFGSLLRPVS